MSKLSKDELGGLAIVIQSEDELKEAALALMNSMSAEEILSLKSACDTIMRRSMSPDVTLQQLALVSFTVYGYYAILHTLVERQRQQGDNNNE